MTFKLNISHKGKALKLESDNEELQGKLIGDTIKGTLVSKDLEGYELTITGTSDKAGFPGMKDIKGAAIKRVILKKGVGMKNNEDGIRIRKTVRGNEVSQDTVQINLNVKKEGTKKFDDFLKKEVAEEKK